MRKRKPLSRPPSPSLGLPDQGKVYEPPFLLSHTRRCCHRPPLATRTASGDNGGPAVGLTTAAEAGAMLTAA